MISYAEGDGVRLKKMHPCGSDRWRILRVGADIKLKCEGCGRILLFSREDFESAARKFFPKATSERA